MTKQEKAFTKWWSINFIALMVLILAVRGSELAIQALGFGILFMLLRGPTLLVGTARAELYTQTVPPKWVGHAYDALFSGILIAVGQYWFALGYIAAQIPVIYAMRVPPKGSLDSV